MIKIKKICLNCGKEFEVPYWRENTAKFCCPECQYESHKKEPNCVCEVCGKAFRLKPSQLKKYKHHCCSRECLAKLKSILFSGERNHQFGLKGKLNASFKGSEILKKNNNLIEIRVYDPTHPYCDRDGRVLKHRLIVEENYQMFNQKYFETVNGRVVLKRSSHVHHLNEDHNDNRIENLIPVTRSEHRIIHNLNVRLVRNPIDGRITGVIKQGELLESPEVGNQQPNSNSNVLEGSETSSRVQLDSNTTTSALPGFAGEDIVRPADITKETAELQDKELVR